MVDVGLIGMRLFSGDNLYMLLLCIDRYCEGQSEYEGGSKNEARVWKTVGIRVNKAIVNGSTITLIKVLYDLFIHSRAILRFHHAKIREHYALARKLDDSVGNMVILENPCIRCPEATDLSHSPQKANNELTLTTPNT